MAFQGDSFQRDSFQPSAGPIDNPPPGKQVLEPYAPNELFEWQPRWSLIQQMASSVGFLDAAANPPFPGSFVLAAVSLIVGGTWAAADPAPQLPRGIAAIIPVAAATPPPPSSTQAINSIAATNWLPPDPGPTLGSDLQPYQPRRLTPPISGPAQQVQPPPGASVPQAVLNWFAQPDVQAQVARNLAPKLLVSDPPFVGGARIPQSGLVWFVPPIPDPMPQQAGKVIESTITNNPPFAGGAQVPLPVLIGWIPPPPDPIMGMGGGQPQPLTPTKVIESTVGNYPPPSRVYEAPLPVLDAWIPPDPAPIVARNLTPPSNPVGAILQGPVTQDLATYIDWLSPDPSPITARNLTPPSGPVVVTYVPPSRAGEVETINAWVAPDPAPIAARNQTPPSGPAPSAFVPSRRPSVELSWDEGPDWEIVLYFNLPQPAPVQTPYTRYPVELYNSWIADQPLPTTSQPRVTTSGPAPQTPLFANKQPPQWPDDTPVPPVQKLARLTPPQSAPPPAAFVPPGATALTSILFAWDQKQDVILEMPGAPGQSIVPQNPPFPGTRVPVEVQVAWIPPDPMFQIGQKTIRSAPVAQNPPIKGAPVPLEVLITWLPPDPQFQRGAMRTPPSGPIFVPPTYRPAVELATWWYIPPHQPILGPLKTPPSGPPPAVPEPLRGSSIDPAIRVWWETPPPPQPPVGPIQPFQTPPPRSRVYELPVPVRMWWDIPPPEPIVVKNLEPPIPGPTPQNPPFMGGAAIPLPVLIDWIPPPPQAPVAIGQVAAIPLQQLLQIDPRFVTWPPARITTTSVSRTEVSYGQARITTFTPPSSGAPRANDLSPIDSTEVTNDVFDFGQWLEPTQTITGIVSTSCVVVSGTDANPNLRLIGTSSIVTSPNTGLASQAVLQRAGQMMPGVLYRLTATVTTSDGQTMTIYGHQLCGVGEFQTANLPPALDFSRAEDSQYLGSFFLN